MIVRIIKEQFEEIKNSYLNLGLTPREIAKTHGVGVSTIYRILYNFGCVRSRKDATIISNKKRTKNIDEDAVLELYKEGKSTREIAKMFGVCRGTIIKRLGRNIRDRTEAMRLYGKNHQREKCRFWKGGKTKAGRGQTRIYMPTHLRANLYGYVLEHILIYEKVYGNVPKSYIIHHINGIANDNRIENLIAMPKNEHNARLTIQIYQKRIRELEEELSKRV